MYACKSYNVVWAVTAAGNGYWDMEEGTVVQITKVELRISRYDDDDEENPKMYAEVAAYHDTDAAKYGLLYTDKGCERGIEKAALAHPEMGTIITDCCGSEQGMQDQFMFSGDANVSPNMTDEKLKALGFEVEYD